MEAPIEALHKLAEAAGLARSWRDVSGVKQTVADDALAAILSALGHEAATEQQIAHSLARIEEEQRRLPAMLVCDVGRATPLPIAVAHAELTGPDGKTECLEIVDGKLPPIEEPGYYNLVLDGQATTLAVAPLHCPLPEPQGHRMWGASIQIPALRGEVPRPFGNFGDLDAAVKAFARRGADALAINPVHAMFPGHGSGYSPYSPSSRQFLNGAMGDPALLGLGELPSGEAPALINWETALPRRLDELRAIFAGLDETQRARIARDNRAQGEKQHRHAVFDALDCRLRPSGARGWQDWPEGLRDPDSPQVQHFAAENAEEMEFHLFVQWLARESLAAVQRNARDEGMAVGLVTDLAVGVDPGGSDSWSMREVMLRGLTIGAPPDPLGPLGQNWSLTGFSPQGLKASGFAPWIAMLRAAFACSGGLRIDHAFGLARLWVIPDGAHSSQGAYLAYPFHDMLRLATLEAHLAGSLIIAEDLGTSPFGFTAAITKRHMLGMRVLWFERAKDHGFIGAQDYAPLSVAMTGTHDTATVAGWWTGRDLDWADRLGRLPEDVDRAKAEEIRDWDRGLLWSTIGDGGPRPAPSDPQPVVEAALAHVAATPACLAMAPAEDLLALEEQPNLPGTITEHPNWRRRLSAPLDELLAQPETARCVEKLAGRS